MCHDIESEVLKCLDLVLNGNIFTFNEELFIKKIGTAMGTKVAPTYACLFMGWLEEEFLQKSETEYSQSCGEDT